MMKEIVVQLKSFQSFSLSSEPRDNTSLKQVKEKSLLVHFLHAIHSFLEISPSSCKKTTLEPTENHGSFIFYKNSVFFVLLLRWHKQGCSTTEMILQILPYILYWI